MNTSKRMTPEQTLMADRIDELLEKGERLQRQGLITAAKLILREVEELMEKCYNH